MILDDNFYLNLAIDEAWKFQGLTYPNPAVGSLVRGENGEILSIEAHREAGSHMPKFLRFKVHILN